MSGSRAITLVAGREIREWLRSPAFLASTLVLLLLVGASTALNGALSRTTTYRVGVIAPMPPELGAALQRAAEPFDAKVRLRVFGSSASGRTALAAKHVDALLLLDDDQLVFRANVEAKLAAVTDVAVRALRRHLPPAPELTTATLQPADAGVADAATLVAIIASLLLLTSLAVYGQWVISGVVEEKNSRVVEVILSTVQPRHLLAGKVIGIGLLGLGQIALLAGLAATLLVAGVFDAPAALGGSLALVVPWLALGYGLYAVAYATAGALASRQQSPDTAGQPVTYTLLVAYFASYAAVSANAGSLLAHADQHAAGRLLRLAGRVYGHGLLHSGPSLGARAAWRLTRQP